MSGERLVLGTRGSALALAQAEMTETLLRAAHPGLEIERKVITTTGDRRTDVPLAEVASSEGHLDKGVFIKELEVALAAGEIDVAVHSLKDVPSDLEGGFTLAAVLERAPNGDVLVTKSSGGLDAMLEGAAVATSSVPMRGVKQFCQAIGFQSIQLSTKAHTRSTGLICGSATNRGMTCLQCTRLASLEFR